MNKQNQTSKTISNLGNMEGVYFHNPGKLTRGSVVDIGLKCVHSCRFCYYSYLDKSDDQFRGMRRAKNRSLEECTSILTYLKSNGFLNFDFTGGEPALHRNIIELTRFAHQELGLKGRMITLGQYLMQKLPGCVHDKLVDDLLEAGLVNFIFSVHAVEEGLFKTITGESWSKLQSAMCYLDEKNYYYTTNTTIFEWNYKHLPQIVDELLKHKTYMHNFIIMNAYYEWNQDGKAFGVQAKYSEIYPYLKEAVQRLEENNVAVNIRYAPLCQVQGMEKNLVGGVGVRYDAYEWMNQAGHMGGSPEFCATPLEIHPSGVDADWVYRESDLKSTELIAARGTVKVFPKKCGTCKSRSACDGVDPKYLEKYGDSEIAPYEDVYAYGPITNERKKYLPAFFVKTSQYTDMKAVMKKSFENFRSGEGRIDHSAAKSPIVVYWDPSPNAPVEKIVAALFSQTLKPTKCLINVSGSENLNRWQENSPFPIEAINPITIKALQAYRTPVLVLPPNLTDLSIDAIFRFDEKLSSDSNQIILAEINSAVVDEPGVDDLLKEWSIKAITENGPGYRMTLLPSDLAVNFAGIYSKLNLWSIVLKISEKKGEVTYLASPQGYVFSKKDSLRLSPAIKLRELARLVKRHSGMYEKRYNRWAKIALIVSFFPGLSYFVKRNGFERFIRIPNPSDWERFHLRMRQTLNLSPAR